MGIPTGPNPGDSQNRQNRPPIQGDNRQAQTPRQRTGLPSNLGGNPNNQNQRPARAQGLPQQQNPAQRRPQPQQSQQPQQPQRPQQQRPQQPQQQRPQQPQQAVRTPQQEQRVQRPAAPQSLPSRDFDSFEDPFSDVPNVSFDSEDDFKDFDNEDPFESIRDYEDEEEFEAPVEQPRPVQQQKPSRKPAARSTRLTGNNVPSESRGVEEEYSDSFVDEKNLELQPFGGKKATKKAKVGDFDKRKNIEGQRKVYHGIFIAAFVAIIGFGAYQTFWPADTLTVTEVEEIASYMNGDTGFPTQRGEAFALSYVDSLLNFDPNSDTDVAKRNAALNYFYSPSGEELGSIEEVVIALGNVKQNIVYGPVAFESSPLTAEAAAYEIGFLLNTTDAEAGDVERSQEELKEDLRWFILNVNVYYNDEADSFAIAPGSPTVLPPKPVAEMGEIPARDLGTAMDSPPSEINDVIKGFVEGYRKSSKTQNGDLTPTIGTNAPESLRNGLSGKFVFENPESPMDSVKINGVYADGPEGGTSVLWVDMTVNWIAPTAKDGSGVMFPSRYLMNLTKSDGGYLVSDFMPYYWVAPSE